MKCKGLNNSEISLQTQTVSLDGEPTPLPQTPPQFSSDTDQAYDPRKKKKKSFYCHCETLREMSGNRFFFFTLHWLSEITQRRLN